MIISLFKIGMCALPFILIVLMVILFEKIETIIINMFKLSFDNDDINKNIKHTKPRIDKDS